MGVLTHRDGVRGGPPCCSHLILLDLKMRTDTWLQVAVLKTKFLGVFMTVHVCIYCNDMVPIEFGYYRRHGKHVDGAFQLCIGSGASVFTMCDVNG